MTLHHRTIALCLLLVLSGACGAAKDEAPRRRDRTSGTAGSPSGSTDPSQVPASASGNGAISIDNGQTAAVLPVSGSSASAAGSGALPMADGTCASGQANTTPVTPTVWLVVDGSSSMTAPFGASDRWKTLRSTLMDPGGVVESLQAVAKFGMVIYAGGGAQGGMGDECVSLVTVQPALNNHATLLAQYPTEPISSGTPTDKALDHVVTTLAVDNQAGGPDVVASPVYVVLATDGQPNDMCGGFGGIGAGNVEQRVVDVTTKGTMNGMRMYVISLAGDDTMLQAHLEQVAAATASKTPPFVPATQQELVQTFRDIVGDASCQINLNGQVEPGKECRGEVSLNGLKLECGSDNGWRLVDPGSFALTGSACASFTSQTSSVFASFPCDIFVLD